MNAPNYTVKPMAMAVARVILPFITNDRGVIYALLTKADALNEVAIDPLWDAKEKKQVINENARITATKKLLRLIAEIIDEETREETSDGKANDNLTDSK